VSSIRAVRAVVVVGYVLAPLAAWAIVVL